MHLLPHASHSGLRSVATRVTRLAAACVLALLATSVAHATPPCQLLGAKCPLPMNDETARGLALGTGARASAISTSALAYNPAALALGHLYHIEGVVDYIPQLHSVALGGAVVDSSTSKIGAGVGLRGFLSGTDGVGGIDGRIGLALPFSDAVSVGLSGRYLNLKSDTKLGTGGTASKTLAQGFTMDAAFRVQPSQIFQLELAALNFIDLGSSYAPLYLATSAGISLGEVVNIGADLLVDTSSFKKPDYTGGGGIELLVANVLPLRVGYAVNTQRQLHTISGGLGYTDKLVGFDLSLQQQVSGGDATRVIGSLRYFVH
jgi:hypothetical protein